MHIKVYYENFLTEVWHPHELYWSEFSRRSWLADKCVATSVTLLRLHKLPQPQGMFHAMWSYVSTTFHVSRPWDWNDGCSASILEGCFFFMSTTNRKGSASIAVFQSGCWTDLTDNSMWYLNLGLTETAYGSELSKSNQTSTVRDVNKVYVTMADVSQRGSAREVRLENGPLVDNWGEM